jgi:hypothetical protein
MYTVVVRPVVKYTTVAWWPMIKFITSKFELSKLQRMACLRITEAMKTAQRTAIEVLIGLPPLHLQLKARVRAGIYRLYCSDQLKPKTEGFEHAHVTRGIPQMRTDRMIARHVRLPGRGTGKVSFNPIGREN